jgi:hypothetical protein
LIEGARLRIVSWSVYGVERYYICEALWVCVRPNAEFVWSPRQVARVAMPGAMERHSIYTFGMCVYTYVCARARGR